MEPRTLCLTQMLGTTLGAVEICQSDNKDGNGNIKCRHRRLLNSLLHTVTQDHWGLNGNMGPTKWTPCNHEFRDLSLACPQLTTEAPSSRL